MQSQHGTKDLFKPTCPYKSFLTSHCIVIRRSLVLGVVISEVQLINHLRNKPPYIMKGLRERQVLIQNVKAVHMVYVVVSETGPFLLLSQSHYPLGPHS